LSPAGTSFAVIYDWTGTAGQSATNADGTTQIGPTDGATLQSGEQTGSPVIGRPAGTGAPGRLRFRRPVGRHERFAQGFSINPAARDAIFVEGDSSDSDSKQVQDLGGPPPPGSTSTATSP
jgi:hypothetical protein